MTKTLKILISFFLAWLIIHLNFLLIIGLNNKLEKADAILIFGNKVEETGEVSKRLKSRLDTGLKLYEENLAPLIIVSGGFGKEGYDEAKVMQDYLIEKGVPADKVIRDSNGNNTYFTVKNLQHISQENSISKVIVVSQYYHLLRAKTAFQKAGDQTIYTSSAKITPELRDLYSIPREIVGFYPYLFKNYSSNYNFFTEYYNGQTLDVVQIKQSNLKDLKSFSNPHGAIQIPQTSKSHSLSFATNGGIFTSSYKPLGLYIQAKEKISNLNLMNGEGNFYLKPNGIFQIQNQKAQILESSQFQDSPDISLAIQSGPLLISQNEINPTFTQGSENLKIRSGVGSNQAGDVFFVISNQTINFYDFANFFKTVLNCPNALYLDGSISEMYLTEQRASSKENFSVIIGL